MSTRTTYYNLTKPDADEHVLRTVINQNYDAIDLQMHANAEAAKEAAEISADEYDAAASYIKGDFCIYLNTLYKANKNTSGTFTAADWDATTIADAFEPKGTWELFETITADGTEGTYDRNLTGRVNGIFLNIVMQAGTEATVVHTYAGFENVTGWQRMGYVSNGINTAARYEQVRFTKDGANLWIGEVTSAGNQNVSTLNLYRQANAFTFNASNINKIRIQASAGNIPTGSTIEIYIKR